MIAFDIFSSKFLKYVAESNVFGAALTEGRGKRNNKPLEI
jgi:hypothetical protein